MATRLQFPAGVVIVPKEKYGIPKSFIQDADSDAFKQFLYLWFVNSRDLSRHDIDLAFLKELTPGEIELAKSLLKQNLPLIEVHIIEGVATFHDLDAVPLLRELLLTSTDPSWQLVIAGSLWRLVRDPFFIECLQKMQASSNSTLKQAHFYQVLWADDEHGFDILVDMLTDDNWFVRRLALQALNALEFNRNHSAATNDPEHSAAYYRSRRQDPAFRQLIIGRLRDFRRSLEPFSDPKGSRE